MSGNLFLDWTTMALSLFNMILLLWLGLTVLLNSKKRSWGIWLAGGSLLLSGSFFICHTAIIGHRLQFINWGLFIFWLIGLILVIALPFLWYVVMLWSAGFWDKPASDLRRGQRAFLFLTALLLLLGLAGVIIMTNPLPRLIDTSSLRPFVKYEVGIFPLPVFIYPLYILTCISLSISVLRHPQPSGRIMSDLARRRARPWLIMASVVQLAVCLLVGWVIFWLELNTRAAMLPVAYRQNVKILAWFDLAIGLLIAITVILLGKPVISYEVFTGKTLPRHGFLRNWRSVVIFAAVFGLISGYGLSVLQSPVYILIIALMLVTVFYAFFSWHSYSEHERFIKKLRPLVASQHLFDRFSPESSLPTATNDAVLPFKVLCDQVLRTRQAYLIAAGPLAPLIGPALAYPDRPAEPLPSIATIINRQISPQTMAIPLEPEEHGGAAWAIPLWSERGLSGVLLLSEKVDKSLYTQEEMEIARTVTERLLDSQASAEIAKKLMALQRQRIAESQILDQQTRRVLHDDVLPLIHSALIALSSQPAIAEQNSIATLSDAHRRISNLLQEMPAVSPPELKRSGLIVALEQVLERELKTAFDQVAWEIETEVESEIGKMPEITAEAVFFAAREAFRNAARYGRKANRPLTLKIAVKRNKGLEMAIEDDGIGIGSTSPESGSSGQGLALHSTMMAVVGGSLSLESVEGEYTRIVLTVPDGGH